MPKQPPDDGRAREFYTVDKFGKRQDAELHEQMLAEGDEAAVRAISDEVKARLFGDPTKEVPKASWKREEAAGDKDPLSQYFENAYGLKINAALRGHSDDEEAKAAGKEFSKAFDRQAQPSGRNCKLYRAVRADAFANLKEGDTFVDKGIVSASADKDWAKSCPKGGCTMVELRVRKGTLILSGDEKSDEQEIALRPGSTFKVLSRTSSLVVVELQR